MWENISYIYIKGDIMGKDFGAGRVLEPKGVVPATAWKLDNSMEISETEALIRLEKINVEWDSFQQICSSCGFNENRIRAKIMDIIEKRGKLHNPFTGTGGCLLGTVEKIGKEHHDPDLKEGDRVYCLASLCGVPVKIDEIKRIDFNYGQLDVDGYGVIFQASPIFHAETGVRDSYTISAVNEAGCLFTARNMAEERNASKVVVIGRNACTSVLYASAVKKAAPSARVIAIMDENLKGDLTTEVIAKAVAPAIDDVIMTDLSDPTESYSRLKADESCSGADFVIVAEDIYGAETLAVFLAKSSGCIYFTTVDNHYIIAQTVAESMGKSVFMYLFDQYIADYPLFTMDVVRSTSEVLDRLDDMYKVKGVPSAVTESRARSLDLSKAGRAGDFIYQSPVTARMVEEVLNIAKYDCNVIIQGETGTGKEKILSLIHENSERHGVPCIKINCATIHENLAESEFFGYEPGSFTGASATGKKGYFEMADNGILFLDEIGSLPFSMQSKLLRVLQENTFYRVGGTKQITVNVRVVAANNVPLRELVAAGTFREDLFYRLNICCIDVPPLRNRREDIICLAESFVKGWSKKYNVTRKLSAGALDVLYRYDWPGNVRELENVVHRLVISATGSTISASSTARILSESAGDDAFTVAVDLEERNRVDFHEIMERQEKQLIEYAIRKGGTTRKAADILGLPQTTFARKKLKYGL